MAGSIDEELLQFIEEVEITNADDKARLVEHLLSIGIRQLDHLQDFNEDEDFEALPIKTMEKRRFKRILMRVARDKDWEEAFPVESERHEYSTSLQSSHGRSIVVQHSREFLRARKRKYMETYRAKLRTDPSRRVVLDRIQENDRQRYRRRVQQAARGQPDMGSQEASSADDERSNKHKTGDKRAFVSQQNISDQQENVNLQSINEEHANANLQSGSNENENANIDNVLDIQVIHPQVNESTTDRDVLVDIGRVDFQQSDQPGTLSLFDIDNLLGASNNTLERSTSQVMSIKEKNKMMAAGQFCTPSTSYEMVSSVSRSELHGSNILDLRSAVADHQQDPISMVTTQRPIVTFEHRPLPENDRLLSAPCSFGEDIIFQSGVKPKWYVSAIEPPGCAATDLYDTDFMPNGELLCNSSHGVCMLAQDGAALSMPFDTYLGCPHTVSVNHLTGNIVFCNFDDKIVVHYERRNDTWMENAKDISSFIINEYVNWIDTERVAGILSPKRQDPRLVIRNMKTHSDQKISINGVILGIAASTNYIFVIIDDKIKMYTIGYDGCKYLRYFPQDRQQHLIVHPYKLCCDSKGRVLILDATARGSTAPFCVTIWSQDGCFIETILEGLPPMNCLYKSLRLFSDRTLVVSAAKFIQMFDISEFLSTC